ncbi:hypothetical protein FOL46_000122 [Perkinsus olseni]|uniref:Uncharacterized protein n=1 Tax=Perkinsus olseni TaxID=32597 RepID=A0A7J6MWI4_PEROL|nr:hypothetical protein FOL46_000122 [Perkinsus olseni]
MIARHCICRPLLAEASALPSGSAVPAAVIHSTDDTGGTFSTASRFASLQRAYADNHSEWIYQLNTRTPYHLWKGPGIIFTPTGFQMRLPRLRDWYFMEGESIFEDGKEMEVEVSGTGDPTWAVNRSYKERSKLNMLAATNANSRMFWLYMSAAKAFNIDVESELALPNMRLLLGHHKTALRLLQPELAHRVKRVYFHHLDAGAVSRHRPVNLTSTLMNTVYDVLVEGEGEFHVVTDSEEFMQKIVALLHEKGDKFQPGYEYPFYGVTEKDTRRLPDNAPQYLVRGVYPGGLPGLMPGNEKRARTESRRYLLDAEIIIDRGTDKGKVRLWDDKAVDVYRGNRRYHGVWLKQVNHLPNWRWTGWTVKLANERRQWLEGKQTALDRKLARLKLESGKTEK